MPRKILVTSALPYVNNVPHLGNLICVLSADVYTRFLRLKKEDVISVVGTDEHGTTTESFAKEMGMTPQEVTDKYSAIHKKIYEWFNTDYDCFGRTSSKDNHEVSQDIFAKLHKNGFIQAKKTTQFFDQKEQTFLADRFVIGTCPHCQFEHARGDQCDNCGKLLEPQDLIHPKSTLSDTTPVEKETEHLYIDLPKIEPILSSWISEKEKTWSQNAKTITHAWLKEKLQPRCITRDLKWGVPVPLNGFENKVFYSWFDAPIGYISITKECRKDWKEWWHNPKDVRLVQFMGKDNTQFHTILFPAFLLGADDNYTLADTMAINEFLNYADGKFSKSRKTGVFGNNAMESSIPADVWRYYLMAIRPEQEDTVFDWLEFQQKTNKELIGNFANLVNRVMTFVDKYFDGKIPEITNDYDLKKEYAIIEQLYEATEIKAAIKHSMHVSKLLNNYFQHYEPWKLIETDKEQVANIIAVLANKVNDLAILLSPIMPKICTEVFAQLQSSYQSWQDVGTNSLQNHKVGAKKVLVEKLEDDLITSLREKYKAKQEKEFPLDLRIAQITDVKRHPDADKLYVIQLDVGETKKQIVSGLVQYYTAEELIGKKIVLVNNLKPAKLRGVESQGMLLAGDYKEQVKVLEAKFSKPGEQVFVDGYDSKSEQITIDDFAKIKLVALDKKALFEKKELQTAKERITVDLVKGKIR